VTRAELVIANAPSELRRVAATVDALAADCGLPSDATADMQVALDEVLTNIIRHGYTDGGAHEIRVRLSWEDQALVAEIEDDGRPFDLLSVPAPDVRSGLRDRPVGGLGIYFVRRLMDSVEYAAVGNRNRLVLRRKAARQGRAEPDAHA
jgi:anti-sigma regulatory factor (Ser/Thr protein kinase)